MTTTTLQMHCGCCDAPATATFEGEEFKGATCSVHGPVLGVPVHLVESMRAVLAERERAAALARDLNDRANAVVIAGATGSERIILAAVNRLLACARTTAAALSGEAAMSTEGANSSAQVERPSTPASRWAERGEPDPHGTTYDCERAALAHGQLTDDELANAVYLCDHRTSLESPGYLMAAKDRIRWLSRRLAADRQDDSLLRCAHDQLKTRLLNCEAALAERDTQLLAARNEVRLAAGQVPEVDDAMVRRFVDEANPMVNPLPSPAVLRRALKAAFAAPAPQSAGAA